MKRENQRFYKLLFISFLLVLTVITVVNLLIPDQTYSETENRMLAERPVLTAAGFLDGRYPKKYEKYTTDQFAFRPFWVEVKTTVDRLVGKNYSNGVYYGDQQYLLEDIAVPDPDSLANKISAMNDFAARYPQIRSAVMLVPDAANVLRDYLPPYAPVKDQDAFIGQVKDSLSPAVAFVDVKGALQRDSVNPMYYKTDHHWTTQGAYDAFRQLAPVLSLDPDAVAYDSYPVTNEFIGSLASKSGYYLNNGDTISVFLPKEPLDYVVTYVEEKQKTATFYEESKLEIKDKYEVFFGGNHPLVQIESTADPNRKLLLIKDSYANCFAPFLAPYFGEITMLDPRYYTGNIEELMQTGNYTDLLFLYNANTFFQDSSLETVLSPE